MGRGIKVTINGAWAQVAMAKTYYHLVPVPLPFAAGVQCLYLRLLTEYHLPLEDRPKKTAERFIRPWKQPLALARKIGIQRRYLARLDTAFKALKPWLNARGGDVAWGLPGDGTLNINMVPASVPRINNEGVTSTPVINMKGQRAPKRRGNEHPKTPNEGVTSTIV